MSVNVCATNVNASAAIDQTWLATVAVRDAVPPARRRASITNLPDAGPSGNKGGVIVLDSNESVLKALKVLEKNDILSAPVWNAQTKEFVGSLDMHHIVNLVATNFSDEEIFKTATASELMEKQKLFTDKAIHEVFDLSVRNPFHRVHAGDTLLATITGMAGQGRNVRRSLVFKDGTTAYDLLTLESILSQTAIIAYLSKHIGKLGPGVHLPLDQIVRIDWEASKQNVVSIGAQQTVGQAFKVMTTSNVSGLAVIDEHAALMGTIGIRDLKFMMVKDKLNIGFLRYTVREYINHVRQMMDVERHPAISLRRTDTFATLIAKIASTSVHRIFIIDENSVPVGVVGSYDVLRSIVV